MAEAKHYDADDEETRRARRRSTPLKMWDHSNGKVACLGDQEENTASMQKLLMDSQDEEKVVADFD